MRSNTFPHRAYSSTIVVIKRKSPSSVNVVVVVIAAASLFFFQIIIFLCVRTDVLCKKRSPFFHDCVRDVWHTHGTNPFELSQPATLAGIIHRRQYRKKKTVQIHQLFLFYRWILVGCTVQTENRNRKKEC